MSTTEKLVERMKPSAVVDHVPDIAVSALRGAGENTLADRLNDWIVRNNDLKHEAADRIAELEVERDNLRSLINLAHPTMLACGWHLAIASEPEGDGVLEAACTEIADKFADAIHAAKDGVL